MADFFEIIYQATGNEEGLRTYRANRDYNKATQENELLRMQTDPNSFINKFALNGGLFNRTPAEDFAGVSNFENLKAAINDYSRRVQEIVDKYNPDAKIDGTFKGKAGQELTSFVVATKGLLMAYVKLIEKWNEELDAAYEKYQAGDVQIQQNVQSDAQAVQQAAQNVSLG